MIRRGIELEARAPLGDALGVRVVVGGYPPLGRADYGGALRQVVRFEGGAYAGRLLGRGAVGAYVVPVRLELREGRSTSVAVWAGLDVAATQENLWLGDVPETDGTGSHLRAGPDWGFSGDWGGTRFRIGLGLEVLSYSEVIDDVDAGRSGDTLASLRAVWVPARPLREEDEDEPPEDTEPSSPREAWGSVRLAPLGLVSGTSSLFAPGFEGGAEVSVGFGGFGVAVGGYGAEPTRFDSVETTCVRLGAVRRWGAGAGPSAEARAGIGSLGAPVDAALWKIEGDGPVPRHVGPWLGAEAAWRFGDDRISVGPSLSASAAWWGTLRADGALALELSFR